MYELLCISNGKHFSKRFNSLRTRNAFIKKCSFSSKIKIVGKIDWDY